MQVMPPVGTLLMLKVTEIVPPPIRDLMRFALLHLVHAEVTCGE
jgi:hypothetical protein